MGLQVRIFRRVRSLKVEEGRRVCDGTAAEVLLGELLLLATEDDRLLLAVGSDEVAEVEVEVGCGERER